MKTPPQIVYELAGSPTVEGAVPSDGRCYLCGGSLSAGVLVSKWVGSGFNDHARAGCRSSGMICPACVFITARTSPVPGRPPGKCGVCDGTLLVVRIPKTGKGSRSRKGDSCPKCEGSGMNPSGSSYRNVSHLWCERDGYVTASKGEKPLLRQFLDTEHPGLWFCAIAEHEKHVLPFARMNGPGRSGIAVFADKQVAVPDTMELVTAMCSLLTDGAIEAEIGSGNYGTRAWMRCEESIRAFESQWSVERGTEWFSLALWLAQGDKEKIKRRQAAEKEEQRAKAARRKADASRDRKRAGRTKPRVHADVRPSRPEALEPAPVRAPKQPARRRDNRSVAGKDTPATAHHYGEQLALRGIRRT